MRSTAPTLRHRQLIHAFHGLRSMRTDAVEAHKGALAAYAQHGPDSKYHLTTKEGFYVADQLLALIDKRIALIERQLARYEKLSIPDVKFTSIKPEEPT